MRSSSYMSRASSSSTDMSPHTDSTPNLEGEYWLMHNGYAQAEGVTNLDKVPEAGALVIIGYPKFGGGLGGYARYIAVCPADWPYGVALGPDDAPLPKSDKPFAL